MLEDSYVCNCTLIIDEVPNMACMWMENFLEIHGTDVLMLSTTSTSTSTTQTNPSTMFTPYSKGEINGDGLINAKDAAENLIAAAKIGKSGF